MGVSVAGVSVPAVTLLLLGVSAVAVMFELALSVGIAVDVLTSVDGGGGLQPMVRLSTAVAAAPRRINGMCFTGKDLREVKDWQNLIQR